MASASESVCRGRNVHLIFPSSITRERHFIFVRSRSRTPGVVLSCGAVELALRSARSTKGATPKAADPDLLDERGALTPRRGRRCSIQEEALAVTKRGKRDRFRACWMPVVNAAREKSLTRSWMRPPPDPLPPVPPISSSSSSSGSCSAVGSYCRRYTIASLCQNFQ